MCFSAEVSFSAGGVISLIGILSARQIRSWRQVMLGTIPFFFAVHQFIEGFLWVNLQSNGNRETAFLLAYLYMALPGFIWPIWLPSCVLSLEQHKQRKFLLQLFVISGVLLSLITSYLIIKSGLNPQILGGHIDYRPVIPTYFLIYCLVTITPFFVVKITNSLYMKILGALFLVSIILSYLISECCAASIWCFFSALISSFIVVLLKKINPTPGGLCN